MSNKTKRTLITGLIALAIVLCLAVTAAGIAAMTVWGPKSPASDPAVIVPTVVVNIENPECPECETEAQPAELTNTNGDLTGGDLTNTNTVTNSATVNLTIVVPAGTDPRCIPSTEAYRALPAWCGSLPTQPAVEPLPSATPCPDGENCPIATFIGASSEMSLTAQTGHIYHLNISVNGYSAGTEVNVMFRALQDFVMVYDGSAWEYPAEVTDGTCQICSETSGDNWIENIPALNGLVQYSTPPCANQPLIDWNDNILIKSVNGAPVSALVATSDVHNGVVAQGGDGTTTITGTAPSTAWAALYWWTPGDSHEYVFVFRANSEVTITGFRGTLVTWDHAPTADEIGTGKVASTVEQMVAAGIVFTGEYVPFTAE